MATTSQLIIYSSNDAGSPQMNGMTGSLLAVLNACLVTGYGNKAPAGWLKPFNDASASAGPPTLGGFTMPSGSGMSVFINDAGYNATALGAEASAIGWEKLLNPSGSYTQIVPINLTQSIGGGSGQFPTTPILANSAAPGGRVVWRKSQGPTTISRTWYLYADEYTFYLFIQTGDTAGVYYSGMFGDIYSFRGMADTYRCAIVGRTIDSSSAVGSNSANDNWDAIQSTDYAGSFKHNLNTPAYGHYMARNFGGGGGSALLSGKSADVGKMTGYSGNSLPLAGLIPYPNGPDQAIYISPVVVIDYLTATIRGKFRGVYQVCHSTANFYDGQIFGGSNEFFGKTFQIVKAGPNAGFWAMEISPTVDSN
jgi:hypothetical protein